MKTYTPEQAAKALQLHPMTVYRYLRKGKLHGYKIHARGWRLTEEDLRAFLRGETALPQPELSGERGAARAEWEALSPEERLARIEAAMSKYEHVPGALERFLAEKHAETEAEESRREERRGA